MQFHFTNGKVYCVKRAVLVHLMHVANLVLKVTKANCSLTYFKDINLKVESENELVKLR